MRFRNDGGIDKRFKEEGGSIFDLLLFIILSPYYILKLVFFIQFYIFIKLPIYFCYTVNKNLYMKLKNKFWLKKENFKFFQNEDYLIDDNILNRYKLDYTTIIGILEIYLILPLLLLSLIFLFDFYIYSKRK
ncbi:hypothetical protein OAY05_00870 [Gammaproteobacteria bacterium]|nr:hypothetical protein [Gammaproteobacteria bacterium]